MAHAKVQNPDFLISKAMSQSDPDLLSLAKTPAGPSESMVRRTSVEDIARSNTRPSRGKRILMKLVRPWTWRKKKKSKKTADQSDRKYYLCAPKFSL